MGSQTMDTLMDFAARKGCPDSTMIEHLCTFLDHAYGALDQLAVFLNGRLSEKGLSPTLSNPYRARQLLDEYSRQTGDSDQKLFELLCDYADDTISATDLDGFLEENIWC